jgi:hypothetical protein
MRNQFCKLFVHAFLGMFILFSTAACREEPPPPPKPIRAIKTITVADQASLKRPTPPVSVLRLPATFRK